MRGEKISTAGAFDVAARRRGACGGGPPFVAGP
jgi:hypothetical protein